MASENKSISLPKALVYAVACAILLYFGGNWYFARQHARQVLQSVPATVPPSNGPSIHDTSDNYVQLESKLQEILAENDIDQFALWISGEDGLLDQDSSVRLLVCQTLLKAGKGREWIERLVVTLDMKQAMRDDFGGHLLNESIHVRDAETARWLLECGADPNSKTSDGIPAIVIAIYTEEPQMLLLLREFGANPQEPTVHGILPSQFLDDAVSDPATRERMREILK